MMFNENDNEKPFIVCYRPSIGVLYFTKHDILQKKINSGEIKLCDN